MIKTRFAPSPTGYIHIGNVRSAIFPYLLVEQAKKSGEGGDLILRIEDTDRKRYVPGATELVLETLRWLGINWDEGPEVGGESAPYFQSERKEIYLEWARKLIAKGRAYADPTPTSEVEKNRKLCREKGEAFLYRNFRPEETPEWKEGMVLRFKAEPKEYKWHDEVMGDLATGPEVCDDIVLIKADGLPTYNFAHIVDDAEMGVTHIFRGVEYLSSMPNYLALYEALGLERPKFVSLPHILAPQGNKKLSKRDGAKSVTDYREEGVLAEAMLNYLACLGWNDGTEQEIYTRDELVEKFQVGRIQTSGARFDETKLLWMNGQWIRRLFDMEGVEKFYERTEGFWPEEAKDAPRELKMRVLAIIYDRLKTLADLKTMTGYFFVEPEVQIEMLTTNKFLKKLPEGEIEKLLSLTIAKFEAVSEEDWREEILQEKLNQLLEETGKKPAELFSLIRIAISFAPFSPALNLTMEVLGRGKVLGRLRKIAEKV